LRSIGSELRLARNRHGLSLRLVASQVAISPSQLSRVERGLAEHAELMMLARLAAVVGLDLVARAYPGTSPIRDSRHGQLLGRLRTRIHPGLGWATEVALPGHGDPVTRRGPLPAAGRLLQHHDGDPEGPRAFEQFLVVGGDASRFPRPTAKVGFRPRSG